MSTKNTTKLPVSVLSHGDAIKGYLNASHAEAKAAGMKATARVEALVSALVHGPFTVEEVMSASAWPKSTATARTSEFNTGARLADAFGPTAAGATKARALVSSLWDGAEGDKAQAVFAGVRAAIKASRDENATPAQAVKAAQVATAKSGEDHKAKRQARTADTHKATKAPTKDDPSLPIDQRIDAIVADIKTLDVSGKGTAAHESAIRAGEALALSFANLRPFVQS